MMIFGPYLLKTPRNHDFIEFLADMGRQLSSQFPVIHVTSVYLMNDFTPLQENRSLYSVFIYKLLPDQVPEVSECCIKRAMTSITTRKDLFFQNDISANIFKNHDLCIHLSNLKNFLLGFK